jgi:hypothetical protein
MLEFMLGIAITLAVLSMFIAVNKKVVVYNITATNQHVVRVWKGKVNHNVLRLEADGESVIVSEALRPYHDQQMRVIVASADSNFEKGGK